MKNNFPEQLKEAGYKITSGRLSILEILGMSGKPLSATDIYQKLKKSVDRVTVYRTLETLADSGVVKKVDFQHPHAHYELVDKDNHHHHLVCKSCGVVEDIEDLDTVDLEKIALKKSKLFSSVKSHSLEFFGLCKKCNV